MKNLREFLIACFVLTCITACFVANEPPSDSFDTKPVEDAKLLWPTGNPARPWTKDIPSKPETQCADEEVPLKPEDQACVEGDSCVVIDRGCCPGEKRAAINWKSLASVKKKLRQGCTDLFDKEAKANNHNVCRNRKHLGSFFNESPRCVNKKCLISETPPCQEKKCVKSDASCCHEKKCEMEEKAP